MGLFLGVPLFEIKDGVYFKTSYTQIYRAGGTGGAGGAIAPPIFLEIGKILAFSTCNIS